ncbi:MAG: hypothetical protein ACXAD7_08985 [Candidatus Kariarchaeaceae archaeon]|jgi:hypothetical protein
MTLVLVVRTIEGIAIVSDTLTTANTTLEIHGEEKPVEYHIYKRKKLGKLGDFAIVHAGLSFLNGKTINQIVDRIPARGTDPISHIETIKNTFVEEIKQDKLVPKLEKDSLLLSIGIVGYKDRKPFVHRIVFFRTKDEGDDVFEIMETEDSFVAPYFGIDYFGDYDFVQLVIRAAKKENLLKPFDILTINEAMDLARTLIRFLIEFQRFMVQFTVAYPIESAVITLEEGFKWVDKMELKQFHHDHGE